MFGNLFKWAARKWAVAKVNGMLKANEKDVQAALESVNKGILGAELVLAYLKSIRDKFTDGVTTDEESDEILEEGATLIEEVMAK